MNRILLATGVTLGAAAAADHVLRLESRVSELERAPQIAPQSVRGLSHRLGELGSALAEVRATLDDDARTRELAGKLAVVESALERERGRIAEQAQRVDGWMSRWSAHGPEVIDERLSGMALDLERRSNELAELRALAESTDARDDARWREFSERVEPLLETTNSDQLWSDLVGPVVQLAGDATVGSGVLLESRHRVSGEGWVTHLMTSWHVVRDIYGGLERVHEPVPVRMYRRDGTWHDETAHMVAFDVELDIALLEMDLDQPVPFGARLASRSELEAMRVFDAVYAVGCPLGNDPIPTEGQIASTTHAVDGSHYWMVSAPTYIGNSGGGIFDARSHALIGIFSKIYTHGAARSTIVPHMGLATPLESVYDWLERGGYTALVGVEAHAQTASAQR